jgi:sugar phosphate isomerase/epimerase
MAKPEIGLSMLYCLKKPFPHLLKHLNEVGVNHVEIPDEGLHTLNQRRVGSLKETTEANSLDLVVHAPWAGINIAVPSPTLRRAVLKRLEKSIRYAKQLDCRLWLFHPGSKTALSHIYPGKDWQLNLKSVRALLKVARREGVEVAIENIPEPYPNLMKSTGDFQRFYEELDDDIGMVLDVAHANLNGQIQDFMKHFSKRIVHIHASDNDGTNDLHLGIGYGSINWENLAKTVKETEYGNLIVLESTDHIEESLQTLQKLFG